MSLLRPYRTCPGCYWFTSATEVIKVFFKTNTTHNSMSEYPWLLTPLLTLFKSLSSFTYNSYKPRPPLQLSSVTQSCLTLFDAIDHSMPGFPVYHQLLELTKIHVHWVGDAIQPSYPLSSPSPPTFNHSQYQGLFQWVSSSHQVAQVLELQLQHQSFQWILRVDFL